MADTTENIVIQVSSQGVDAVQAALEKLGVTGQASIDAIARVGLKGLNTSAEAAAAEVKILNAALSAGVNNLDAVTRAVGALTNAQLIEIASVDNLTVAFGREAAAEAQAFEQSKKTVQQTASAAQAHLSYANGANAATTASSSFSSKLSTTISQLGNFNGSISATLGPLGRFAAAAGAYVGMRALMQDSDDAMRLSAQLQQATTGTGQYNEILAKLTQTANNTGQSVNSVVKSFFTLEQQSKNTGASLDQLAIVQDTLSNFILASGVRVSDMSRVMKDFGEVMAGTGNSQRLINSLWQQAPQLMNALSSAGVNVARTHEGIATSAKHAGESLAQIRAEMGQTSGSSSASLQLQMNKNADAISRMAISGDNAGAKYDALQQKQQDLSRQLSISSAAEADYANSVDNSSKSQQAAGLSANSLINGLIAVHAQSELAASTVGLTFAKSFNDLTNSIIIYLTESNAFTNDLQFMKEAIVEVGGNISTIIPIVTNLAEALAFTAALAGIIKLTAAMAELAKNPLLVGAELAILGITALVNATGGWSHAIYVVETGLVAVVNWIGNVGNALDDVLPKWAQWAKYQNIAPPAPPTPGGAPVNPDGSPLANNPSFHNYTDGQNGPGASPVSLPTSSPDTSPNGIANPDPFARDGAAYAFATGGVYTVPGGGGVDSVPVRFMASPGEIITVQTPQQRQHGEVNTHNTNSGAFASGGAFAASFGAGVTAGLSGVNAQFQAANANSSIIGYSVPGNYYTNLSGANNNTPSSGDFATDYINKQLQQLATDQRDFDSLYNLSRKYDPSSLQGEMLSKQMDSILSSDPYVTDRRTGQTGIQEQAGTGTTAADATTISGPFGAGSSGGIVASSTSSSPTVSDAATQSASIAAKNARLAADYDRITKDSVITAVNGVSRPANGNSSLTAAQASQWVQDNGIWKPITNDQRAYTYAGDFHADYAQYLADQATPARDGVDLTVPGGSGTDRTLVPMKVSPGETISVRTPEQMQNQPRGGNGGGNVVINMPISTPDANSFRQSAKQIAAGMTNAGMRARRKVS